MPPKARGSIPRLRTSERTTFNRCRYLWYLNYVLQRRPNIDRPPLRFGTLIHGALAAYYKVGKKRGPHPARTFEKLYAADAKVAGKFGFRVEDDEVWADAASLGYAMLSNYVDTYGADDEWEVLATEQPFAIRVRHATPFEYVGVVDGIWRYLPDRKLWIPDHKTAAAIEREPKYLLLDEQAGAYWTFALEWIYRKGILKRNQKLAGMLYNYLRKQYPDKRPRDNGGNYLNQDGITISKKQPAPYFMRKRVFRDVDDRQAVYDRVQRHWAQIHSARREAGMMGLDGDLIFKNPTQFTCRGCSMIDICEMHEIGGDWMELMEATTSSWNPYDAHEVRASEQK